MRRMQATHDPTPTGREELATALKRHGHRMTRPRELVWGVLAAADGHLTAEEVTAATHRIDAGVNRASVYRALALFGEMGIARESSLGADSTAARWELAHPDDHFHLVCDRCGGVDHHAGDLVEQIRTHLDSGHGFVASQVELSVRGVCEACAAGH